MNESSKHTKIYLLMVLAAFFWSGAFIAGKFAVPYIPPCTLTFLRFFFAVIILYFVMKAHNKKLGEEAFYLKKEHIPFFLFTGIVGMIGYHILFFSSLQYTTAINSSVIGAANPIVTTIIASILLKSKVPPKQLLGILLSFLGVILTITSADLKVLTSFSFNKGDLFMLAAVLCWAAYAVVSKSKGNSINPIALTYYSFLFCCFFSLPLVILEKPWTFIHQIPISAWAATLYMSIFASVIGYLVQQMAIKEIGPSRSSVFVNLVPVFSIILAVIILGEELVFIKVITAALIIAGVYICQKFS
ncbi:MAG: DMT family transporter [Clostridiales bacterium]|nr:DMT family transporter [Clostridiales bacterium]